MEWLEAARLLASWTLMSAGGLFILIGAVGMLRFPDFWSRLHAAGIIETLGAGLLILGLILQAGLTAPSGKLLLIGIFLLVTIPTATHALANAAFSAGVRPAKQNGEDL